MTHVTHMNDFTNVQAGDFLYATYSDNEGNWHIIKVNVIATDPDNVWLNFTISLKGKRIQVPTHKLNKVVWSYIDAKHGVWISPSLEEIKRKYNDEVDNQISAMRAQVDALMMNMISLAKKQPEIEE